MTPYYDEDGATIFLGDCREVLPAVLADVMVTDPPYGLSYKSGMTGHYGGNALPGITGDEDASLRDSVLDFWGDRPALVFGSWKVAQPRRITAMLTWDKGDHVGMGDLSLPWKPNTEEVYVLGRGFVGHRGSSVLRYNAPVTWNSVDFGRAHAHEKPVALMVALVSKCPTGVVLDPFMGAGSTLVAAKRLGRMSIGIEIKEKYCEIAAKRLAQRVLPLNEETA